MRFLISVACICIIAFVGYFFWGEYEKQQASQRAATAAYQAAIIQAKRQLYEKCDAAVKDLKALIDANITSGNDVYLSAQHRVNKCLIENKNSDWFKENIHVKTW